MADQPQTPKQPTPAAAPQRKQGVSAASIIILLVALGIMIPVAFYYPEIKAYYQLQPWNQAGPRQALQQFFTAVQNGDQAALEALAVRKEAVQATKEGDKIVALKVGGGPMQPATPTAGLKPSGSLDSVKVEYRYKAPRAAAMANVPIEGGGQASFILTRPAGHWVITGFQAYPPAAAVAGGPTKGGEPAGAKTKGGAGAPKGAKAGAGPAGTKGGPGPAGAKAAGGPGATGGLPQKAKAPPSG